MPSHATPDHFEKIVTHSLEAISQSLRDLAEVAKASQHPGTVANVEIPVYGHQNEDAGTVEAAHKFLDQMGFPKLNPGHFNLTIYGRLVQGLAKTPN